MHKMFTGYSYSDAVSKALSKCPEGNLRFDLLKFIARQGECRFSQISRQWSSDDVCIHDLLEDLIHDLLIHKRDDLKDHIYSVNSDMFMKVLNEMSDSAKRCILDSENILFYSQRKKY